MTHRCLRPVGALVQARRLGPVSAVDAALAAEAERVGGAEREPAADVAVAQVGEERVVVRAQAHLSLKRRRPIRARPKRWPKAAVLAVRAEAEAAVGSADSVDLPAVH